MNRDFKAFRTETDKLLKMCLLKMKDTRGTDENAFWGEKVKEILNLQTSIGNHENWGI